MSKIKKPQRGKPCPRCRGVSTLQLTNFGQPMRGRFQCFGCKRTWDEVHASAPDFVAARRAHSWRAGDIGRVCVDCLKYEGEVETDSDCTGGKAK